MAKLREYGKAREFIVYGEKRCGIVSRLRMYGEISVPRQFRRSQSVLMGVAVIVLAGCSFVGCAPKKPVLGTRDVCGLFDAGKLAVAVPEGKAKVSELSRDDYLGASGTCRFANFDQYPAGGEFEGLTLDIRDNVDPNAAEAHEDAVNFLRNTCASLVRGAAVQGSAEGSQQWCERTEPDALSGIVARYWYAVRRDQIVVLADYEYRLPADAARIESVRQVTRAVAESAFH